MALRAVPDHPKFAQLKAILRLPKGPTAGWLEMMWHFCGRFTPQGNIGKYSDHAIESWLEWDGEPGKLIEAFIEARWIDRDPVHRLLVHDWHQHADKATKNALTRAKLGFSTPTVRTESVRSTNGKLESSTAWGLPVPEPVPEPEPKNISAAAFPAAAAQELFPVAFRLPALGGVFFEITEDKVKTWQGLYLAVDVEAELRKMVGWLDAAPDRRKTLRGMPVFVVRWLSKVQDEGGGIRGRGPPRPAPGQVRIRQKPVEAT